MNTDNNSEVRISPLNTFAAMFAEPGRAFAAVQQRSMAWLPLLLIMLGSTALFFWYFQIVDFAWLQDRMVAGIPEAQGSEAAHKLMSKDAMQISMLGGTLVGIPLFYSLVAMYFLIVAKIKNLDLGFTKWFSFVSWASLPALLSLPLGAMQILLASNGQLELDQLNPVSLNQLFFHIETGKPWASLLESIDITSVWSAVLMVVGFQVWSKASRSTAILVVAIPYAVIYGVWIAISLGSAAV